MWGDQVKKVRLQKGTGVGAVTCSLLANALSVSKNFAVFPHVNDVVVAELGATPGDTCACKLLQCGSTVMHVRILKSGENDLVFVGTVEGIQLWEPMEGTKLASYTLPAPATPPTDRQTYARGFAMVCREGESGQLVVGSSTGALHVLECEGFRMVYVQAMEGHHSKPIADIASTHETDMAELTYPAEELFAVADEGGSVSVWAAKGFEARGRLEVPGECFTCVKMRGANIYTASLSGRVYIFDTDFLVLKCEIQAHARAILAIALHPSQPWLTSVSEDTFVNIWNLENLITNEIEALASKDLADRMLCGTAFVGEGGKDIAIVHYDSESISILPGDKVPGM